MRIIGFILSVFLLMTIHTAADAQQSDELTDLASIVNDSSLAVDGWQVTIKETMNKNKIDGILEKLQAKNSYKVSSAEDENTVKYFFERVQKDTSLSESFNVVISKNPRHKSEFIAVLEGEDWNKGKAAAYLDRINTIQTTYFTKKSTKFACLMTDIDAKIEGAYFFDKLQQRLNLSITKTQTDNNENSTVKKIVYGYTPLWNQAISTEEPMNLQIVVQDHAHGSARLTIGTPILINEY
ncbi:TATA-box binding [Lentibacillus persicus]|uniref:TATA-box binding n=1 Tax=Lentibacillus persicus TaxID=640948 RepID=A0A1I1XVY3_9BACI|nr:YwmB family TATA-box binding protein [Lentibacillus persicus]SFE10043.1 TATA-box binding [Lentibacillus persicus]